MAWIRCFKLNLIRNNPSLCKTKTKKKQKKKNGELRHLAVMKR